MKHSPTMQYVAWMILILLAAASNSRAADRSTENLSTFFVGRLAFGSNKGHDCGDIGADLVKLVARASTIEVREQKLLNLSDEALFQTPFVFMNGHNDFVLSEAELENLRRYFANGGFCFASGCCTNPAFPRAWRRELSRVFPGEQVRKIPYNHLIYRSFYKMERLTSVEKGPIQLEGLFHDGELVAAMGEDGLCCSFAMDGSCNAGHGVPPDESKKIALNICVYALTH
ncbi:MAG TPA: DUF4159 domain-containing protein [Chthoniobacterales bacterium]